MAPEIYLYCLVFKFQVLQYICSMKEHYHLKSLGFFTQFYLCTSILSGVHCNSMYFKQTFTLLRPQYKIVFDNPFLHKHNGVQDIGPHIIIILFCFTIQIRNSCISEVEYL